MTRSTVPLASFNRGEVSRLALGRVDVDKLRLAAEEMVNWVPHTLGPMQVRPGTQYVGGTAGNARAYTLPFVYSVQDLALLELTPGILRVLVNDAVLTRPATGSTFPGGAMDDTSQWVTTVQGGAGATIGGGQMLLDVASIGGFVLADSQINVASPGLVHALRIVVLRGPVSLRVGTAQGLDNVLAELQLDVGFHSIAFTPPGNVWVEFQNRTLNAALIQSATLEAPGELSLPTPWTATDLPKVRWDQSADVMFLACAGKAPQRIQRPAPNSWSVVPYRADDGPFQAFTPANCMVSISPPSGNGQAGITATRPIFRAGHANSLIRVFTPNANATFALGAPNASMPPVRVSGVGASRTVAWNVSGTWSGGWQLERSISGPDSGFALVPDPVTKQTGTDSSGKPVYTTTGGILAPGSVLHATANTASQYSFQDDLDNVVAWYRLTAVDLTSGVMNVQLIHGGSGGATAVLRITAVISPVSVQAQVLQPPSSNASTDNFQFGAWSDDAGWPSAVALFDGRLGFAGNDNLWLSVADAFNSFAAEIPDGSGGTTVGDSSAISRSIGYGPVAVINAMLPLTRLLLLTAGSEVSVRSSALDAPLTPTGGMAMRDCSTYGSNTIPAAKCDTRGLFADRSGRRLMQLGYDVNSQDYGATDLTRLHPDLNLGNPIMRIAVQRQPNTRIHCLRQDGTAAVLVFEPNDDVAAWYRVETFGIVEDIYVTPGLIEDVVYYTVNRNGVRYRERFARLDQARGGALNRMADCHVIYQGAATATITGLGHLNGRQVSAWGDGKEIGLFTVAGGQITLPAPVAQACVGLPYQARWRSAKLAYGAPQGSTALNSRKRLIGLGLVLADTHNQGLFYGQSYGVTDSLPYIEDDAAIDQTGGSVAFDEQEVEVPGDWDTDSRLCLVGQSPRPCTVMAASLTLETSAPGAQQQ